MFGFVKIFLICFAFAGGTSIEPLLHGETDNGYCQTITVDPSEAAEKRERIMQDLLEIRNSFFTPEVLDSNNEHEEFKGIFIIDTKFSN